jgi:hypothetical protein
VAQTKEVNRPKDYAFPGCCGISALIKVNPKLTKAEFIAWIRENRYNRATGLAITASKKNDTTLIKLLEESGFKTLASTSTETVWYRRIR